MKQRLLVCISDLPVELISVAGHALSTQRSEHGQPARIVIICVCHQLPDQLNVSQELKLLGADIHGGLLFASMESLYAIGRHLWINPLFGPLFFAKVRT